MSGRSGYVRIEQAMKSQKNHQEVSHTLDQAVFQSPDLILSKTPYISECKPERNPFYGGTPTNLNQDAHLYPTHRYGFSLQSRIEPKYLISRIERSSFRTKMDEKCIRCRNGIRKIFGIKEGEKQNENSKTPERNHPNFENFNLPYNQILSSRKNSGIPLYLQECYPSSLGIRVPSLQIQLRRWLGNGRPSDQWAKLQKDPELFDLNGDTLIYLCSPKIGLPWPAPSLRINSSFIEATNSAVLIKMLYDGSTEKIQQRKFRKNLSGSRGSHFDGLVSYQIFFPPPSGFTRIDALRHQVTTRNIFALLLNASIVGQTMYQALYDLRDRVEEYMPNSDPAGVIIDWIKNRAFDDPRYNPSTALSLLAWAERDDVRWEEGWKEAFCHIVGMRVRDLDKEFELLPEYQFLSPITKTLVNRFSIDTQLKVQECECRLENFEFADMWDVTNKQISDGRSAFDRFQKFLVQHYQKIYGAWPPNLNDKREQWLTRSVAKKLSLDFAALYDYLVNRAVSWDCAEERAGRKWNMKCAEKQFFDPDNEQLPMIDILIAFDNRMRYPHIPHPYCLTPEPKKISPTSKDGRKRAKKSGKTKEFLQERQASIAYQNSTNIYLLGSELVSNDFVDAYIKFESEDRLSDGDPYNSRRGRWILIYGILQVLASISVDVPHLRFTQDVDYHLQSSLRGTPPWIGANQNHPGAEHTKSHCWLVPDRWRPLQPVMISRYINKAFHTSFMTKNPDMTPERNQMCHSSTTSQNSSREISSSQPSSCPRSYATSDLSSPASQKIMRDLYICDDSDSDVFNPVNTSPKSCEQFHGKGDKVLSLYLMPKKTREPVSAAKKNSSYHERLIKYPCSTPIPTIDSTHQSPSEKCRTKKLKCHIAMDH